MHFGNLAPLLRLLPLFGMMVAALGGFLGSERRRSKRRRRRHAEREKRYRAAELAYRAKMWVKEWLSGLRTPRLTYQGPPLAHDTPASRER
jgi:hypothetical protein